MALDHRRMIPPFDDSGCLPPGVHSATLAEIEARFGRESELRRAQMESIGWMVELAKRAGVQRIVLNGSFVTDTMEPNDVDCVLLVGPRSREYRAALRELRQGLPFLDLSVARARAFDEYVHGLFAADRAGVPARRDDRGHTMELRNERELANTRQKLARLEALYEADEKETGGDEELREIEIESLKRTINQFREEIARYEARHVVQR